MAGLRPQREVEEEEDGPGCRGDEATITEVPQRHTGHGGRASIALHYTAAERERERVRNQHGVSGKDNDKEPFC